MSYCGDLVLFLIFVTVIAGFVSFSSFTDMRAIISLYDIPKKAISLSEPMLRSSSPLAQLPHPYYLFDAISQPSNASAKRIDDNNAHPCPMSIEI